MWRASSRGSTQEMERITSLSALLAVALVPLQRARRAVELASSSARAVGGVICRRFAIRLIVADYSLASFGGRDSPSPVRSRWQPARGAGPDRIRCHRICPLRRRSPGPARTRAPRPRTSLKSRRGLASRPVACPAALNSPEQYASTRRSPPRGRRGERR